MKKFVCLIIALAAVINTLAATVGFTSGGIYYDTNLNGYNSHKSSNDSNPTYVRVSSGSGTVNYYLSGTVTIPATVTYGGKTYKVDEIGYNAFINSNYEKNTTITSINVGENVTYIAGGSYSGFCSCSNLSSITFNSTAPAKIENEASAFPSSVNAIYVPSSAVSTYKSAWPTWASKIYAIGTVVDIKVTDITISGSTTAYIGKTITLTATCSPSSATNKSVTWKSSNTSVATVSSTGVVTGVSKGSATITATAQDGSGKSATYTVTVKQQVTSISLNNTTLALAKGKTSTLTATVTPSTANNTGVTWSSSNTSVATVSTSGVVTAIKSGTATITCTASDGNGAKATCSVTVTNPITSITLNNTSATLWNGKTLSLSVTYSPSDADNRSVTWSSSNTSVATVSTSGVVTAKSKGTATITATTPNGKTATCSVTVKQQVTSITLNKTSLPLENGKTGTLTATVTPSTANTTGVTWSSSDTSVATVSTSGVVTAVSVGTATITCTASDGQGAKATCSVTVTEPNLGDMTFTVNGIAYNNRINGLYTKYPSGSTYVRVYGNGTNYSLSGEVEIPSTVTYNGNTFKVVEIGYNSFVNNDFEKNSTITSMIIGENVGYISGHSESTTMSGFYSCSNLAKVTFKSTTPPTLESSTYAFPDCVQVIYVPSSAVSTYKSAWPNYADRIYAAGTTVNILVTGITISGETSVYVGKTTSLAATCSPSSATNKSVTWKSSNTSVATVSSTGVVTGVAKGTATITATAQDGSGMSATHTVTVNQQVTGITLNNTTLSLAKGATSTLTTTIAPTNASNTAVAWSSSNTAVATVSTAGVVTAVKTGTATITCTAKDGQGAKATCAVTVTTPVSGVTISKSTTTITIGGTETLTASTNSDADNKNITWSSSDETIATVSSTGVVTAVKVGKATITATSSADATKKATCTVKVANLAVDGIYYKVIDTTNKKAAVTYATTDYNSYSGDVVIPAKVTISGVEYSVTEIGDHAFNKSTGLTSLTVPSSISTIGNYAFSGCSSSVFKAVYISDLASWCSIAMGGYNQACPLSIAHNLYLNGELVTKLVITSEIPVVEYRTFEGCTSLQYLSIDTHARKAFTNCTGLKTIIIGEHATIHNVNGNDTFEGCSGVKDVYIQRDIWTPTAQFCQGSSATIHVYTNKLAEYQANSTWSKFTLTDDFDNPSAGSLSTIVGTNPTSLKVSGDLNGTDIKYLRSLINDNSLTDLDMSGANIVAGGEVYNTNGSNNYTTQNNVIGTYMFANCTKLASIVLPNNITSIYYNAFRNASALTSLTIPKSVTTIKGGLVELASNLKEIIVEEGNTKYMSFEGVLYNTDKTSLIAYPNKKGTSYEVPDGVKIIEEIAFGGCKNLTAVTLPSSITGVKHYAFGGCTNLTTVVCKAESVPTVGGTITFSNYNATLKVPYASLVAYRAADRWKNFTTITSIEGYAESVSLDKATASILPHQTITLTATTVGANPDIVWTTSDATIATVENGVVTAKKAGTVTITATANDGGKVKATCTVTVGTPSAPANVELVDLGLPSGTLWATMNVGATAPEEFGGYYAWGEVQEKESYTWATYKWCNGTNTTITKYCTDSSKGEVDNKTILDPEDDAAYVNWGSDWVMPSRTEMNELIQNCTFKNGQKLNGVSGYIVTGRNGNTIFLPAVGYMNNSTKGNADNYWNNSLDEDNRKAGRLYNIGAPAVSNKESRHYGFAIRPVSATQHAIRVTSVTLNKTSEKIVMGKTAQLTATIAPADAWDKTYSWSSSDENVATVDAQGNITTVGAGTATITASAKDGSGKTATCAVQVIARGDVNGDGTIDNADITADVKFIMGDTDVTNLYADAADYNNNGKVTSTDAIAIVRLALTQKTTLSAKAAMAKGATASHNTILAVDDIVMESGTTKDVAVRLADTMDKFTNLMFDVALPDGVTIDNVSIGSRTVDHSAVYSLHDDGTVRVICYSLSNENFTSTDGDIVKLTLKADKDVFDGVYDINFSNIKLVRKDVTSVVSNAENVTLNIGGTTGMRSYNIGDNKMSATYHDGYLTIQAYEDGIATVHAASGALVYKNKLHAGEKVKVSVPRGIYIINGTKTAIK